MSATAHEAIKIVKANNLEDKVTIIHGKVEEITLPVDKVPPFPPTITHIYTPNGERRTYTTRKLKLFFLRVIGNILG